jgi:hypothetical protein
LNVEPLLKRNDARFGSGLRIERKFAMKHEYPIMIGQIELRRCLILHRSQHHVGPPGG